MSILEQAILSSFLQVLLDKLASPELLKFLHQQKQVEKELKKWEGTLVKLYAVLEDAEEKQLTNQLVKLWLSELRDLAYDVEDILDEFATEAARRRLVTEPEQVASRNSKLLDNLIHGCKTVVPCNSMFILRMGSKMKRISSRLEEISNRKTDLDLGKSGLGDRDRTRVERLQTTCLLNEAQVLGRDEDKEAVLDLLLRDYERSDNEVKVRAVAVLGMGGVGKTTLAQLIYNDKRVKDWFDLRIWACVSDEFDVSRVTKAILESALQGSIRAYGSNLNSLQGRLRETLMDKKFLLVLDDVWNEDYHSWDILSGPLRSGAPGSKVVVTTRNESVASIMGCVGAYRLKELSYDSCLPLFTQIALGRDNFDGHLNLKEIGEGIVRKCQGLPLAAKTLASLLRTKIGQEEWDDVLHSKIWELPEESNPILPALRLSYHYLASQLKQCFAYCAIFPKDYEFRKEDLVLLWMAEGFLQCSIGTKRMENLGAKYFDDLVSRSMFQQSSRNGSRFVMHDLINDLAQYVAGEVCFKLEEKPNGAQHGSLGRARYASYIRNRYESLKRFELLHQAQSLRTLLPLPVHVAVSWRNFYMPGKVTDELLSKLSFLRVLSFSGYCISEIPDTVCRLKLLRYLNLSYTSIKILPESVSFLCNLQTLILDSCTTLSKLPAGVVNLVNLRHLDISNTGQLLEMPLYMGRLKNLRTLSKFIIGKGFGSKISELGNMLRLRGTLVIRDLQNVANVFEVGDANLRYMQDLQELVLEWGNNNEFQDERDEALEMDVLDMLQPHKNLKMLEIRFYAGSAFPSWISDSSFSKITKLALVNCSRCTSLPSLGKWPFLEDLSIRSMPSVKSVGLEFYGDDYSCTPFLSLKTLTFTDMANWEDWCATLAEESFESEFPCLRELHMRNCPSLIRRLPNHLPSLVKLDIGNCPLLAVPIPRLPALQNLNLEECSEVVLRNLVDLSSLASLQLRNLSNVCQLPERLMQCSTTLKVVNIINCNELSTVRYIGDKMLPCTVEGLELCNCNSLNELPDWIFNFTSLKELKIKHCSKLVSFPELQFPSMFKHLRIEECEALECLPSGLVIHRDTESSSNRISNFSHLESLEVIKCPSLKSLPRGELPSSLKVLKIWDCTQLESLSEATLWSTLSLECLSIRKYANLRVLPESLCRLIQLNELHISYCVGLESFPERGLPTPNLRRFYVFNCPNLKSLPKDMKSLQSLQHLGISSCPGLVSFPPGGLPPNLISLRISNCENLGKLSEWSLHKLVSLKDLAISGECQNLVLFPYQCQLPPTITSLRIGKLHNLEHLPMKLGNLTSLEVLEISECPKLRSLPKEGLPGTLSVLEISDCPILKGRFMKKKGRYYSILTSVPKVEIDEVLLQ